MTSADALRTWCSLSVNST